MSTLSDVISRYDSLCSYCDSLWNKAALSSPEHIHCKIGCSGCCELETVCVIEAIKIAMHLRSAYLEYSSAGVRNYCIFLENNKCNIYECRPVICRTHGLLLKSDEHSFIRSCLVNFQKWQNSDQSCILDWESLTMNLMRINMAFCILAGIPEYSSERIKLSDIASGNMPDKIKNVYSKL